MSEAEIRACSGDRSSSPRHLRQTPRFVILACAGLLGPACVAFLPAQNAGSREVQVSSRPYVPPSTQRLRVQTTLVEVGVVVRDSKGRPIAGLQQSNFKIYDEGKERAITAFSVETSSRAGAPAAATAPAGKPAKDNPTLPSAPKPVRPPRFLALYFDDIHTLPGDLGHAQLAAKRFVREALEPDDRVAIFTTSSTQSLDFTNEAPNLLEAIEKLRAHPRISESGMMTCPRITPYQAYLITEVHDPTAFQAAHQEAVLCNCPFDPLSGTYTGNNREVTCSKGQEYIVRAQAQQTWDQARVISQNTLDTIEGVVDALAKMPGSRMLLLTSAGFLAGSLEREQDKIIQRALRAGVVINSLDAKGLYAEAPGRPINEILETATLPQATFFFEASSRGNQLAETAAPMANFAESTGGLFFHNNNDLDFGFYLLGVVPEITYRLGFQADDVPPNGKYHKLKVELKNAKHSFLQARRGYFALSKEAAEQATAPSKLDRKVSSTDTAEGFPVNVSTQAGRSTAGAPILWVVAHVDLRALKFQQEQDRHIQKLTFVMALFDPKGNFVVGKEGEMNLALRDTDFAQFAGRGVSAKMFLDAVPGTYQLRTVVQEAVEGRLTAVSREIEIR